MIYVVGLGSNLGDREATLVRAQRMLAARPDIEVLARSALYTSAAVGPPQPDYLNAALRLETELSARELLDVLLEVERLCGRVRAERWGPRTLDLDILFWAGGVVDEPGLRVPHPRLAERAFAIAPLLDVAPELAGRYSCDPPPTQPWSGVGSKLL